MEVRKKVSAPRNMYITIVTKLKRKASREKKEKLSKIGKSMHEEELEFQCNLLSVPEGYNLGF